MTVVSHSWVRRVGRVPAWCLAVVLVVGVAAGAAWHGWAGGAPQPTRYDGQAAVRVEPRTADELAMVLGLSADVWSEQLGPDQPVVVVVSRENLGVLAASGVPFQVVVQDIQAVADAERMRLAERTEASATADWFAEYRDVQEVSDYMDMLGERWPDLASLRRLGTSVDGRAIRAIEISRGGKIKIVLNGGQHAREWISVMVPMCIADRLLSADGADSRIQKILDSVSFYVAPLVNPDGYVHSWNVDRYWRKNRRGGHGVDLNRNFSVAWGQAGSSGNRRSQIYRGEHAFSEPESRAMRELFVSEDITAHIDFHSFSQLILYPWNYQGAPSPDRERLAAVADRMSTAIYAAHGKPYKILPGAELYPAGGTLSDWSYGEQGAMSFVIELRPSRSGGFVLPPEQIVPTCDESFAAVLKLAELMIRDASE